MTKIIVVDGNEHVFPDDATDEDINSVLGGAAAKPTLADLPGNIPGSAWQLAKDVTYPIREPKEFAQGVYKIATDAPTRAAVGQFYKDRYGGMEQLHDTLIKDPVGMVSDLASVMTLGGTLAAKLPGQVGRVAAKVAKVGATIDPIMVTGKAAGKLGEGVGWAAKHTLGQSTLAGPDAVAQSVKSGFTGDKTFVQNMREDVPMEKVLEDVDEGVRKVRDQAQADYRRDFPQSAAQIDPTPIHEQFAKIMSDADSPGTLPLDKKVSAETMGGIDKVRGVIDDATTKKVWVETEPSTVVKNADGTPAMRGRWERTPKPVDIFELDALKQKLNDMYPAGDAPDQVKRVIANINHKIGDEIGKAAPDYLTVMEKYGTAAERLKDIRKSLSQTQGAGVDTKLMKLRRGFNATSEGKRAASMIDELEAATDNPIRSQMAGQMMQNWLPGGGRLIPRMGMVGLGLLGAQAGGAGVASLGALGAAPFFSPRLVGEAGYKLGQAGRFAAKAAPVVAPLARTSAQLSRPLQDERVKRAKNRSGLP